MHIIKRYYPFAIFFALAILSLYVLRLSQKVETLERPVYYTSVMSPEIEGTIDDLKSDMCTLREQAVFRNSFSSLINWEINCH